MRRLDTHVVLSRRDNTDTLASGEGAPHTTATAPSGQFAACVLEARVERILRMTETGTALTIRDLALEFHLSPSYLQRLFKHETGVCMGEWLNERRLQRAAHLLTSSYMSVKEIAHDVGYEHASSFIRAFERRFTQAPARYRKQYDYTKS